ncbi:MAG: hypothetical protein ACPGVT_05750, partial [Maricaulaceae bacterium]
DVSALKTHFFPLLNISNENIEGLIKVLMSLSEEPQLFDVIADHIITTKPKWGRAYLDQLLRDPSRDLSNYLKLYAYYPNYYHTLPAQLLKRDGVTFAHHAFMKMSKGLNMDDGFIVDPEFTQKNFQWPFGWRLKKAEVGRQTRGGVSVVYFGRGTPVLLEQVVKIERGAYTANISISGQASRTKGYYSFRIKCWEGQNLGNLILDKSSIPLETFSMNFEVIDESCSFIQVQLIGQAGAFPDPVRTHINKIQIKPLYSGQE